MEWIMELGYENVSLETYLPIYFDHGNTKLKH